MSATVRYVAEARDYGGDWFRACRECSSSKEARTLAAENLASFGFVVTSDNLRVVMVVTRVERTVVEEVEG